MPPVEIDPDAVVASASSLKPFATDVAGPSKAVSGLADLKQSPLAGEFDQMRTAWSKAIELLGKDVGLVGAKVESSGKSYSVTEGQVHKAFTDQRNDPVSFTPPSSGPPY